MALLLLIFLVCICIALTAFFSGAETAIVSADKPLLHAQARRDDPRARQAKQLLSAPSRLLATTLVGTNLACVTATTLATVIVARYVSDAWQSVVTTIIMTPVLLLFGEVLPKSIARGNALTYTLASTRTLYFAQKIMSPLVTAVSRLSIGALRLVGVKEHPRDVSVTREEVQALADISAEQGMIGETEHRMISRVFELNRTTLSSVMAPLVDLASAPVTASIDEALAIAQKSDRSRLPVYEERAHNIVGLVHIVDLLDAAVREGTSGKQARLANLVDRTAPFMPETKPVGAMLRDLQSKPVPAVFVVDEYGGVVGMITIRDLAEEVVGDLALERPEDRPFLVEHRNGMDCEGRVDVDVIGERLGIAFDKDGYDTIAGLVLKLAGRVPQQGEAFAFKGFPITVLRADRKRIIRVRIGRKGAARE